MRRLELAVCTLLFLCACGRPDDTADVESALKAILATCSNKTGDVQVKRKGEGFWTDAQVASVFRAGDWVKTSGKSYARIELQKGGALELDENATLVLEVNPRASGAEPLVQVEQGTVTGSFTDPSASGLTIRMADGSEADLLAQGDKPLEFKIQRGKSGTDITLRKGAAKLQTKRGEAQSLTEGSVAAVSAGALKKIELLAPPALLAPLADASFAADTPVTFKWSAVKSASGYRLQLSRSPSFETVVFDELVGAEQRSLPLSTPGGYWWRVSSNDEEGRPGSFGRPSRVFALSGTPKNLLLKPEDKATYAYGDAPPRITFAWSAHGEGNSYKLVIAKSPDLLNDRLKSEQVTGLAALVDGLEVGQYYWGVYTRDDEPLFTKPFKLSVQKAKGAVLKAPKRIESWGQ